MARDRNVTVWQGYVTVMSIVSVICFGTLAWLLFTSGTNSKLAEDAQKKARDLENQLRQASSREQLLQSMLGAGKPVSDQEFKQLQETISGNESLDGAVKIYTNHMSLLDPTANERTYTKLVDTLMQELRARNIQVATTVANAQKDNDNYTRKIQEETKLREEAQDAAKKLSTKMQSDLEDYTAKSDEQVKRIEKLEMEKQQQFSQFRKEKTDLQSKLTEVTRKYDEQIKRTESLVRKIEEVQNENFQYVQGKVTEVADGFVWINLGRDQGLRPGVNFIVMDSDVSQVTQARVKAKIEVVEVVSTSLARAKVLDDRAFTTILKEDKIYAPLWQPGAKVRVALVGKMDIDGDGRDDRERLKTVIEQNGATVEMDAPPAGRVEGKLSEQVRWLVIGEEMNFKGNVDDDPNLAAARKKRIDIETQAKSLGITKINLNKLWSWLQANEDGAAIGSAARPKVTDYLPEERNTFNSGRVSELFQTRDGRLNNRAPE